MKTRCKFVVTKVAKVGWQGMKTDYFGEEITLAAICGSDGGENQNFAAYTPTGTLTFMASNPAVVGTFKPGGEYYLDLIPVDPVPAPPVSSVVMDQA